MVKLSETDLLIFQKAVLEDYGIKLEKKELYNAAFNLLQFIEALIRLDKKDAGSKTIPGNPLNTPIDNTNIK